MKAEELRRVPGIPVTHKACQCEFLQGEVIAFLQSTEVEVFPDERWWCPMHGLMTMDGPVEK